MTDALNPSLPVGGNQLQIASELRGIKSRLVIDKANIEALQVLTNPLISMGDIGALVLAADNVDAAQTSLGASSIGKAVFMAASQAAAKSAIGVTEDYEVVNTSVDLKQGTITWAGGFRINFVIDMFPTNELSVTWRTPFSVACFGGLYSWYGSDGGSDSDLKFTSTPDRFGADVYGDSGKMVLVVGFGI